MQPISDAHMVFLCSHEENLNLDSLSMEKQGQSVVLSGLGVILCDPIPLGRNTTPEGKHVHCSEFKMLDAAKSKLL